MPDRLFGRVSLRWRMVLLAGVAVTVILLIAGVLLSFGLRRVMTRNALDAARLRAHDLAVLAADGNLPDPIPISSDDEALVQVVVDGRVVAASPNITGEAPLPLSAPPLGTERVQPLTGLPIGDDDRFDVVSLAVTTPQGAGAVFVAISLDQIAETVDAASRLGLLALPALVLVLSGAMWVVVGRTLRPIDAIRQEADAIGGEQLGRRVPEPDRHDEVGRLARTLNRMLARIDDGVARQRRFVGDAAHELRSPIATLRTRLETARDARDPVDWGDVSTDLLAETLRMQRLTEQLLLLARLDATPVGGFRAVDLDEITLQAAAEQMRQHPDRTIDIRGIRPAQIPGQPTLLAQVARNLLDNAARHATRRVAVTVRADDDGAVLTVDDDGPGIPPEQRQRLFERFTRLDEARDRDHGGAGLGLAIVADIVAAHDGTVTIGQSPELGGARVSVRLPGPPEAAA